MGRGLDDYDAVTLSMLGGGAVEEKFQVELDRVLRNIADPNTGDGKRVIELKIVFYPNTQRTSADIAVTAVSKLQADKPYESHAYLGREGAAHRAWEHNPEQLKLPVGEGHITEAKAKIGGVKHD